MWTSAWTVERGTFPVFSITDTCKWTLACGQCGWCQFNHAWHHWAPCFLWLIKHQVQYKMLPVSGKLLSGLQRKPLAVNARTALNLQQTMKPVSRALSHSRKREFVMSYMPFKSQRKWMFSETPSSFNVNYWFSEKNSTWSLRFITV